MRPSNERADPLDTWADQGLFEWDGGAQADRPRHQARRNLRSPRTQWRREDDDDQHHLRHRTAERRRSADRWQELAATLSRSADADWPGSPGTDDGRIRAADQYRQLQSRTLR